MSLKEEALKILGEYKEKVWPLIKNELKDADYPASFAIPQEYRKEVDWCWQVTREYPERQGKYLRPTLLCLVNEALGGKREKALVTAAAMQISEEWLLIHDDVEDNSKMRRGEKALHRIYGIEQAINAGDILHLLMWQILNKNQQVLETELKMKIEAEFSRMLLRTALGQGVEQKWAQENREDLKDEDWEFIADGKTSYYSMAGPMRLGAMIAGADEEQLEVITRFGKSLGRCFQMVDDLLDVTSDFSGLKTKGNDIYEAKRTVILIHLINQVKGEDKEKLTAFLNKEDDKRTEEEVSWVLKKMKEYKSIEYGQKKAKEYQATALNILNNELKFLSKEPARKKIETLVEFILKRDH